MTWMPNQTSPAGQTLVVGIGSPHGDDQAGWLLIDRLAAGHQPAFQLRKANVPHDMIDWMHTCLSLHIADACDSHGEIQRIQLAGTDQTTPQDAPWPQIVTQTRSRTSHQLGIGSVIQLADSLGILPQEVVLWTIPGSRFSPQDTISDACAEQIRLCADRIQRDLGEHKPRPSQKGTHQ
jgi:hydrogenase maturation protease